MGFPAKESACNAGDLGLIPGLRSPGGENDNPFHYSCLENCTDRGSWQATVCTQSFQLCPTVCNPMDYCPPDSSVHGILQARILEWVAISYSKGSSRPRDRTCISYVSYISYALAGGFFTTVGLQTQLSDQHLGVGVCVHGQLCGGSSLQELTIDQPLGFLLILDAFSSRHAKLTFPELTLPNSLQMRSPSFEGWGHADPKLRKGAAPLGEEGPAVAPCDPNGAEFTLSWSMVSNEDFKLELRGQVWVLLEIHHRPISITYKIQPSVALFSSVPAHPLLYVKKNFKKFLFFLATLHDI